MARDKVSDSDLFNEFPIIDLGDIVLRELTVGDAPRLLEYLSDRRVNRFISDEDIPETMEQACEEVRYWSGLFTYRRCFYWAIAEKDTNKIIGTCGYNMWSAAHSRAEISYDLDRDYWNNGIMTRALKAIVAFGFEKMKVARVQATVNIRNAASIRVLEKLGFEQEGLLRKYGLLHGKSEDSYMYSRIA